MSQFNLKITNAGAALFADLIAGSDSLAVTKLAIGSGDLPEGVTAEEMTALADQEAEQNVVTVTADDEVVTVRGDFTNAGLVTGYLLKELGVFAADPDEGPDILIAYGNAGDNAGYMPAEGTNALTLIMQAIFTVSGGLAVTVNIDPGAYVDLVTWGTHLAGAGGANQHPLATAEAPGLMSADDKVNLQLAVVAGHYDRLKNKTYWLIGNVPFAGRIRSVTTRCLSGTATVTCKIGAIALGGNANSVSSVESVEEHETDNEFVIGDDISFEVTDNNSCLDMRITLNLQVL